MDVPISAVCGDKFMYQWRRCAKHVVLQFDTQSFILFSFEFHIFAEIFGNDNCCDIVTHIQRMSLADKLCINLIYVFFNQTITNSANNYGSVLVKSQVYKLLSVCGTFVF